MAECRRNDNKDAEHEEATTGWSWKRGTNTRDRIWAFSSQRVCYLDYAVSWISGFKP